MSKRIIKGEGPRNAPVLLCGEALGADEEYAGRPFVGPAGRLLDRLLAEAGITRTDCYITNIVQTRPPGNDFGIYYTDKSRKTPTPELLKHRARVRQEIREANPRIIVPLGNEALRAVTEHDSISTYRGSIIKPNTLLWENRPPDAAIIPTYHPAAILRQWDWYPYTFFDLQKVKRAAETPNFRGFDPTPNISIVHNTEHMFTILNTGETYMDNDLVSFDIETSLNQIDSIAFCFDGDTYVFPFFDGGESVWSEKDEIAVWQHINYFLSAASPKKVAHNAMFDMLWLSFYNNINVVNLSIDTMLLWNVLHPELEKGLDVVASILTDMCYWKSERKAQRLEDRLLYNGKDAWATWFCAKRLMEIVPAETMQFYRQYTHSLIQPLMRMTRRGIAFDAEAHRSLQAQYQADLEKARLLLNQLAGQDLNAESPKQVAALLYDNIRLPRVLGHKTKRATTDDKALESLCRKSPKHKDLLEGILNVRGISKALGKDLAIRVDPDQRLRCSYNIAGTEIGRLSASETPWRTGTNHQNVTKGEMRRIYRASEGRILLEADYEQAELRVVANLSGDPMLLKFLADGNDVHSQTAALMLGKPLGQITKEDRFKGKVGNFALCYGMTPYGVAHEYNLPLDEAKRLHAAYFAAFLGIGAWHRWALARLCSEPVLVTPFGRRRRFWGRFDDPHTLRSFLGFIPEATVADLCLTSLREIAPQLPDTIWPVAQVHDALIFDAQRDSVETAAKTVVYCMVRTLKMADFRGQIREFTIPVSLKIGPNWEQMTPYVPTVAL